MNERVRALDGLRALAVLAVLGFHFGWGWLPGGFLGVDVFYVLSGFLITTILVNQFQRRGSVALRTFWAGRARRLLPCLFLVLIATSLFVRFVALPGTYLHYRSAALSTLLYFSNWYQIHVATDYFVQTGPPSPLTHTWSLAIEEQFYLVWPLVVLAVMHTGRRFRHTGRRFRHTGSQFRRSVAFLFVLSLVAASASAAWMAYLFAHHADTTRLYFGTDTHAQCILVGSALACLLVLTDHRPVATRWLWSTLGLLGAASLAALVLMGHRFTGASPFIYQGGFLLTAGLTACVIATCVTVRSGLVSRLLSLTPLVGLGVISYGVYLWHYPLAIWLTPARLGLSGWELAVVRLAVTIAVSTVSFLVVERPIMRGTFFRRVRSLVPSFAALGGVAATIVVTSAATGASAAPHHFRPRPTEAVSPSAGTFASAAASTPALVPPRKLVVLGDSTALVLGYALAATAPATTQVVNGGLYGCGLAIGTESSADPPTPGLPRAPTCNSATPPSDQWPALDAEQVASTGPGDLVVFLAGRWETTPVEIDGVWHNITQPWFQTYERHQLAQLVQIATAHGAHLDLLTMPRMDTTTLYGEPPTMNDSSLYQGIYNAMLYATASADPGQVSVVDYNSILCPDDRFRMFADGVQIRTADGIHTPAYVPGDIYVVDATQATADAFDAWLSPRLWPLLMVAAPTPQQQPIPALQATASP